MVSASSARSQCVSYDWFLESGLRKAGQRRVAGRNHRHSFRLRPNKYCTWDRPVGHAIGHGTGGAREVTRVQSSLRKSGKDGFPVRGMRMWAAAPIHGVPRQWRYARLKKIDKVSYLDMSAVLEGGPV